MFASGSSFMLSLVRIRPHQNATVIISQLAKNVQNRSAILLCYCCQTTFPLQNSFSHCLIINIMPFVSDKILKKIFENCKQQFTPTFIDKFLQYVPNGVI